MTLAYMLLIGAIKNGDDREKFAIYNTIRLYCDI